MKDIDVTSFCSPCIPESQPEVRKRAFLPMASPKPSPSNFIYKFLPSVGFHVISHLTVIVLSSMTSNYVPEFVF